MKTRRILLAIFSVLVVSKLGAAADVRSEISRNPPFIEGDSFANPEVLTTLTGKIVEGDYKKVASDLSPYLTDSATGMRGKLILILDSKEGGDYGEALKIIKLIREYKIATYVRKNAECVSACAFIFLAGTDDFWGGSDASPPERRNVLEAGGRVCLHAPFREYGPGNMRDGLEAAQQMIAEMNQFISPQLMAEILAKQPEECLRIKTIEDAIRFGIEVSKYQPPPNSVEALVVGSINANWSSAGRFYLTGNPLTPAEQCEQIVEIPQAQDVDEYEVGYCHIDRSATVFRNVVPKAVAGNKKAFELYHFNNEITFAYFYLPPDDFVREGIQLLFHSKGNHKIARATKRLESLDIQQWNFDDKDTRSDWFMYPPSVLLESIARK
ncbi:hypothetical protein [Rhizobium leguminosarum]|uniref:hypothetical protein n=1 Tax=Rhizobium leguminosarum TaxID=384 RepID=UPI001F46ED42|nr:hypothetical protein [Rhizobium leguminosarum]UIJ83164.1 hypothetical protein LZK78_32315 [Rhizobium leguminosarum]